MLGAMTFLPTFLQYVEGVSATVSGLQMLPLVVGLLRHLHRLRHRRRQNRSLPLVPDRRHRC